MHTLSICFMCIIHCIMHNALHLSTSINMEIYHRTQPRRTAQSTHCKCTIAFDIIAQNIHSHTIRNQQQRRPKRQRKSNSSTGAPYKTTNLQTLHRDNDDKTLTNSIPERIAPLKARGGPVERQIAFQQKASREKQDLLVHRRTFIICTSSGALDTFGARCDVFTSF